MNSNCKLSVIIPCYNIENYLSECLDSIRMQSYQFIQVVLVDDGSTDSTGAICDKYVTLDARFKVVHQKNCGSSIARKNGLALCDTEYVTFVDGDDTIHPSMYSTLMKSLSENPDVDIAICGAADVFDGKIQYRAEKEVTDEYVVVEHREAVLRILDNEEWQSYMVNKIYKKSLFNQISFPIGRNLDEDVSIMHQLFHYARNVLYNKTEFYYYRHREGSTCLSYDIQSMTKKAIDRIAARWERLQFTEAHPEYHEMLNKQRNMYMAIGLAVMRIAAKYPSYFQPLFFEDNLRNMKSVKIENYMPQYFNMRKRIELFTLLHVTPVFKLAYRFIPAWKK